MSFKHLDVNDIYTTSYSTKTGYTLFSSAQETFTKIHYILHCKTNLKKWRGIKTTENMFSDYNELQVQPTKKEISKISKTHGNETTYHQIKHETKRKTQGK